MDTPNNKPVDAPAASPGEASSERSMQSRKLTWAVLLVALGAVLIAGSAVWLYRQRAIDALEAKLEARDSRIDVLAREVERLGTALAARQPGEPATSTPATSTASSQPPDTTSSQGANTQTPTASKEFTFLTQVVESGGSTSLVADFAQLLTGEEAAKAAAARGDESPPPNDYYILNENSKLRTLPVSPSATVSLTTTSEGATVGPNGYKVSLSEFVKAFAATPAIRAAPYYVTITNGQVSAIAEVYLP